MRKDKINWLVMLGSLCWNSLYTMERGDEGRMDALYRAAKLLNRSHTKQEANFIAHILYPPRTHICQKCLKAFVGNTAFMTHLWKECGSNAALLDS